MPPSGSVLLRSVSPGNSGSMWCGSTYFKTIAPGRYSRCLEVGAGGAPGLQPVVSGSQRMTTDAELTSSDGQPGVAAYQGETLGLLATS